MADFDVNINPDSPPREPISVTVIPDRPPTEPFPVEVIPDGPGPSTFPVPVFPDGPPSAPIPVSTFPDVPPRGPTSVDVNPDGPPWSPIEVNVTPDVPVSTPVPVEINPDTGPRPPVPVSVMPSSPPWSPVEVATVPDGPPVSPFDVPVIPDAPALTIQASPGATPTIDQIISAVSRYDRVLGSFLEKIVEIDPVTASGPGGSALDPTALAAWLKDYRSTVGDAGVLRFITEQEILYALNPVVSRVFDPTYFLKMLVPGSMGHAITSLDAEAGINMRTVAEVRDRVLQEAVAANPLKPGGDGLSDRPDLYGPENTYLDGQAYSVDSIVDGLLSDDAITGSPGSRFSATPYMREDGGTQRFDASAFFEDRTSGGAMLVRASAKARAAAGIDNVSSSRLSKSSALNGIIRVGIPGEETDGSVLSSEQDPSSIVDDDDARLPISFTDLRQVPGKKFRSVYFRPENVQLGMSFAPEYSKSSTFGRVDPVVGYQRTTRTVSLSFDVFAMAPEDLELMYNKMVWLQSMVYPSYGVDSLMESGPVTRLRVGDIISTDLGGLPGVIESLSFEFSESTWELQRGKKVPMHYHVSLEFLALHDGPVGSVNGEFGVFQLPPGGNAPDKDTNNVGNPNDSRSGQPQGVSLSPGKFFKFGEPRK